ALCPLWVPHRWESNRNKLAVAAALGLPVLALYLARRPAALLGMAEDYVSFMVLLAGLYVMSGGIHLTGDLEATPLTNSVFLAVAGDRDRGRGGGIALADAGLGPSGQRRHRVSHDGGRRALLRHLSHDDPGARAATRARRRARRARAVAVLLGGGDAVLVPRQ